ERARCRADDRVAAIQRRERRQCLQPRPGSVERRALALRQQSRSSPEPLVLALQPCATAFEPSTDREAEAAARRAQRGLELSEVGHGEGAGGGGRGGPRVRGEVAQGRVLLVANGRDDRDACCCDGTDDALVAERKEILEAPAPAG